MKIACSIIIGALCGFIFYVVFIGNVGPISVWNDEAYSSHEGPPCKGDRCVV